MTTQHYWQLLTGLQTSLILTLAAIALGCVLALAMTMTMILKLPILDKFSRLIIFLFTGTPLLVQIFLIYYGPGQFASVRDSIFWNVLREPWFCALLALGLNSAAYSSVLFKGAFNSINKGQWHACRSLGMNNWQSLKVLLPFAIRRAVPAYSNEIILVFKGTSLASTITIMDLMGYAQRINGQTYQTIAVFSVAGAMYLAINGFLTIMFRMIEKKALAFESGSS